MEISANLIKELREKTGAGIVDCKKALIESTGDLEKAIEILRKTGAAKAEKKSGRTSAEGRVAIGLAGNQAAVLEVNCETDFVAKNEEFQKFVSDLAQRVLTVKPQNLEALLASPLGSQRVKDSIQGLVLKIGENIVVRRFVRLEAKDGEKLGSYVHLGNKIGVLVRMKGPEDKLSETVLKDVAMHVAAAFPQYLSREQIPESVVEKEKEIFKEQMKDLNKPAPVLEKILQGKIAKFAEEVCLISQAFVKDPTGKLTVAAYLKQVHPEIEVVEFVRYQVGEGIAKKEEDFAADVARQRAGL